MKRISLFSIFASFLVGLPSANATYSIVGADTKHKHVGIAMASCVKDTPLWISTGSAPGAGLIVAQAQPNIYARADGQVGFLFGAPADAVIGLITDPNYDPDVAQRQYGIVDLMGGAVAFTGKENTSYAGDRQGKVGTYVYSVQGNTLTGADVINLAADSFEKSKGCDLADKLMRALEAASSKGGGDNRCTPGKVPASRAYLQVDKPGQVPGAWLALETGYVTGDPTKVLRKKYTLWRLLNRCP